MPKYSHANTHIHMHTLFCSNDWRLLLSEMKNWGRRSLYSSIYKTRNIPRRTTKTDSWAQSRQFGASLWLCTTTPSLRGRWVQAKLLKFVVQVSAELSSHYQDTTHLHVLVQRSLRMLKLWLIRKKKKRFKRKTINSLKGIAVGKGSKTRVETEQRVCNQLVLLCVLK